MYTVSALYHFCDVTDPQNLRDFLYKKGQELNLCGTLIVAHEGINGTVGGSQASIKTMMNFINAQEGFEGFEYKLSTASLPPFHRFKVKVKKEIVTLGLENIAPHKKTGTHVSSKKWNTLMEDPNIVVIDTRNDYEYNFGTFRGALNPKTENFRAFPEYVKNNFDPKKHKKVAMFCTGGIRCEKASAYMLNEGFEEVYHLKGGILKYLEEIPKEQSLWDGTCFVFDQRIAIGHGLCEETS
jgi:UPF0176 protein